MDAKHGKELKIQQNVLRGGDVLFCVLDVALNKHSTLFQVSKKRPILGYQDGLSACLRSPRHQQQLLSPTRRHPSPLHFPDLSGAPTKVSDVSNERELPASPLPRVKEEAEEASSEGHSSSSMAEDGAIFMKPVGRLNVEHVSVSGDVKQMSCDHPDSDIPSVQSIGSCKPNLPPVSSKLVQSQSTERILDILNQRSLEMKSSVSEEQKETPLSSTPAMKSSENIMSHDDSMVTVRLYLMVLIMLTLYLTAWPLSGFRPGFSWLSDVHPGGHISR